MTKHILRTHAVEERADSSSCPLASTCVPQCTHPTPKRNTNLMEKNSLNSIRNEDMHSLSDRILANEYKILGVLLRSP